MKTTSDIVRDNGDHQVTYVVTMRIKTIAANALLKAFLEEQNKKLVTPIVANFPYEEGEFVTARDPIVYLSGSYADLFQLEGDILKRIGPPYAAAINAYVLSAAAPRTAFIAMDMRFDLGEDTAQACVYGASVGSRRAQQEGAAGFVGNTNPSRTALFPNGRCYDLMRHSFIGYAGGTEKAAALFARRNGEHIIPVIDYAGAEVSDTLSTCRAFSVLAEGGRLIFRLDTGGNRYIEGLNEKLSREIIARSFDLQSFDPALIPRMVGPGSSVAAYLHLREQLDLNGFTNVGVAVSADTDHVQCKLFGLLKNGPTIIATGSYIPLQTSDMFASADVLLYNGNYSVKAGKDLLIERHRAHVLAKPEI